MADVGVKAAASSGGLSELAQIRDTNSERDCQKTLASKTLFGTPCAEVQVKD